MGMLNYCFIAIHMGDIYAFFLNRLLFFCYNVSMNKYTSNKIEILCNVIFENISLCCTTNRAINFARIYHVLWNAFNCLIKSRVTFSHVF